MSAIGFALALIGPFGSFAMPFAWRLIYWMSLCYAGYFCYQPLATLIVRLGPKLDLPAAPLWVLAVLVATVPMSAIVWIVGYLPGRIAVPNLEQAAENYFRVLVIGTVITLLFNLLDRNAAQTEPEELRREPAPPASQQLPEIPEPEPRFLDRLPPHLGSDLLALEMEDHYVRAHTALGSDLILMRMRDAVAELGEIEGEQVHRSWWVARHAVEDVRREGRNVRLVLAGGLEAPVSRANIATLKDTGWI